MDFRLYESFQSRAIYFKKRFITKISSNRTLAHRAFLARKEKPPPKKKKLIIRTRALFLKQPVRLFLRDFIICFRHTLPTNRIYIQNNNAASKTIEYIDTPDVFFSVTMFTHWQFVLKPTG